MMGSPTGQAHPYVDIVHRAALMYSFASLAYFVHALLKDTDNQLRAPFRLGAAAVPRVVVEAFMWSLIAAELGGFVVLFYGAGMGSSFW